MKQGPTRFECKVCGNRILTDWRDIIFYNKRKLPVVGDEVSDILYPKSYIEICSYDIKCDVCGVSKVYNIIADEVDGNLYAQ